MRLRPWRKPALRPEPLARAEVVGALIRDAIERDGSAAWRARGQSMGGSIADGEALTLVAPTPGSVRRGAVVMAALADGRLAVHRVRAVHGGTVVLRGDTCRRPDPPVPAAEVIAVVEPTPKPGLRSLAYSLVS